MAHASAILLACLALFGGAFALPLIDPPERGEGRARGELPYPLERTFEGQLPLAAGAKVHSCLEAGTCCAHRYPAAPYPAPSLHTRCRPAGATDGRACPGRYVQCLIDPCYNGGGCSEGYVCQSDCECTPDFRALDSAALRGACKGSHAILPVLQCRLHGSHRRLVPARRPCRLRRLLRCVLEAR